MRSFDARTTGTREQRLLERWRDVALEDAATRVEVMQPVIPRWPLKVQIQTSTRCNAACRMCPYPEITNEPGFDHASMSEERFEFLLAQMAGTSIERLSLFLMNEPLLDRRLVGWVTRARAALPEVTLGLFSNGAALRPALAEQLADAGLDELTISVHGFDQVVYEDVMRGLRYDRVRRQLADVFERAEDGRLGPLRLQVVLGDVDELRETRDHADARWSDHVLLKGFSNEREVVSVEPGLSTSERPGASRNGAPSLCQRPLVKLYVLADGTCILCNVDWRRQGVLGRLGPDDQTIAEVWNGERARAVRRQHFTQAFESGLPCNRCDYASVVDDE